MVTVYSDKKAAAKRLERELYENLNARNYLLNVPDAKAYVMGGDLSRGVIVSHEEGRNFLATRDAEFMDAWWGLQQEGHCFFTGVPCDIAALFLEGRKAEWDSPCKVYALTGEFAYEANSPHVCESLLPSDAEEVDEFYTYRHEGSLERLRHDIANQASSCVRIEGELAAWCMVHGDDETLGPLYTKEKFRRQGLGELVSADIIRKQLAKNAIPYVHIVQKNEASLGLVTKFRGMSFTHDCLWFGVVK